MRKFSIILIFLLVFARLLYGQWEELNKGFNGYVNSIEFVNEDVGWMAGSDLEITYDGGINWSIIPLQPNLTFEDIDFLDEYTGWAACWDNDLESFVVLSTIDGGYTWTIQSQLEERWYNNLQVINEYMIILASDSEILKSSNGGSEWINISPNLENGHFQSANFLDNNIGVACGSVSDLEKTNGFISRTLDGGSSWHTVVLPEFNEIYNFQFDDQFMGYFLAIDWEENWATYLCHTVNYGQSWSVIYESTNGIDSYFLSSNNSLYISDPGSQGRKNLLYSSDGGRNWDEIFSIMNWQIPFIMLDEEHIGMIICKLSDGYLMVFSNRNEEHGWKINEFSYPLNDVVFINQNFGFIVGGYHIFHGPSGGDILATRDGGVTWSAENSIPGWIKTLDFFGDSFGYLITIDWGFSIEKSTDSGKSWKTVYENRYDSTGFEFYGYDIFLSSEREVWTAGNFWKDDTGGAAILRTTDGGSIWDLFWTKPNDYYNWYNLNAIHGADNHIWAVGERGLIVHFLENQSSQVSFFPTELPLTEVIFTDSMNGWIAGGYGHWDDFKPLLLTTHDGGSHWEKQEDFPHMVNEFFFRDSLTGWAVGYNKEFKGVIMATTDGGRSWIIQKDNLMAPLTAVHFVGDYGWAVGDMGQVYKTENGGINWIKDTPPSHSPEMITLYQNYPNPFNPTTKINYQLPITNYVELTIYNILGQKLETLVSEKQKAGIHQVEWDGSGFASGVYIYRLKVANNDRMEVRSRKLVLMK